MNLKQVFMILIIAVFILLLPLSLNQEVMAAGSNSGGRLFDSQEWQEMQVASSKDFAMKLEQKLNSHRDLIGKAALRIVQTNDNAKYRRTDSVFIAPRDGGGYVYGFVIRWFRDLFAGIGKDLTTKITWEILDGQHFGARVVEDSSIFSPTHSDDLDKMFKNLLPDIT